MKLPEEPKPTNLDEQERGAYTELVQGVARETGHSPEAVTPATSQEVQVTQSGRSGLPQFDYPLPGVEKPAKQQPGQMSNSLGIIDRVKGAVRVGQEEVQHLGRSLSGDEIHDLGYHFPKLDAFKLKASQVANKLKGKKQ